MELAEKLDQHIEESADVTLGMNGFVIDNMDTADWAVRKIARAQAEIEQINELAKRRTDQIKAWQKKAIEEQENTISFFENLLEPFAKEQLKGQKKKSLSLPSGLFGFKAQQPEFVLAEKELTEWADKNAPDYIKKELVWGEFKKAMKLWETGEGENKKIEMVSPDGEVVPHVTITERPDKFYVKGG